MPKFSTHVALMDPSYQPANFGPGDEVPEWALDQVGAHVLEAEDVADDEGADDSESDAADESGAQDEGDDSADEEDTTKPADDQPDFTAPAPARRGRGRK